MNAYIITFLVAMVPIVELRGAIPVGVVYGLDPIQACIIAMIGNMVPVPIIYLFARKVLIWGSKLKHIGGFFRFFLDKSHHGIHFYITPSKMLTF